MDTDTSPTLPVNHHADHPGFGGVSGFLIGLTMTIGRGAVARLAAELVSVTTGDRLVDVGCGPGTAAREAARRGALVTGVDPAPVMLRLARMLTPDRSGVAWLPGTAEALPLPDATATVLWSLSTVHHWSDVTAGLAEAHRVLRSGGRLLAVERRAREGATAHASHGWTDEQAESFAEQCEATGFVAPTVSTHRPGRGGVVAVHATRA
jgi:ubiquinone/menaquinone biosynthesis C-methylase UbiE